MAHRLIHAAHKSPYDGSFPYKPPIHYPSITPTGQTVPSSFVLSTLTRTPSKGVQLLELPYEILRQVFTYIHPPWSALVSHTCTLSPIPNLSTLLVSRTFHALSLSTIHANYTGTFTRWDRRGLITHTTLPPHYWYSWLMSHTTTLVLEDAIFRGWYLPGYWSAYPRLRKFTVKVGQMMYYQDHTQMPDFEGRKARCEERTDRWRKGDYAFHCGMVFTEVACAVWPDVLGREDGKGEGVWPEVEYDFHGCPCHPNTRSVVLIAHRSSSVCDGVREERFHVRVMQVTGGKETVLHDAVARFTVERLRASSYLLLRDVVVQ